VKEHLLTKNLNALSVAVDQPTLTQLATDLARTGSSTLPVFILGGALLVAAVFTLIATRLGRRPSIAERGTDLTPFVTETVESDTDTFEEKEGPSVKN
jgi:hypothetical protein